MISNLTCSAALFTSRTRAIHETERKAACSQVGDWQLAQQVHAQLRAEGVRDALSVSSTARAACTLARRLLQPLLSSLFPQGQRRLAAHGMVSAA